MNILSCLLIEFQRVCSVLKKKSTKIYLYILNSLDCGSLCLRIKVCSHDFWSFVSIIISPLFSFYSPSFSAVGEDFQQNDKELPRLMRRCGRWFVLLDNQIHISCFLILNIISFHWWINNISGLLEHDLEEGSNTSGLSAKITTFPGGIIKE